MLLIVTGGALLMHLRDDKPGLPDRGCWSGFGGAVEDGETDEQAMRREVREETGLEINDPIFLAETPNPEHDGRPVALFYVVGDYQLADIKLQEGAGVAIHRFEDLAGLNIAPFLRPVIEKRLLPIITGPTIRRITPADAPRVAELLTQLGYPATGDEVSQRLSYWLGDAMSLILVAEQDNQIVGCLSLHSIPYLERTGRWARIESLVVDSAARGTGTGRCLVAAAEEAAQQWECLAVEVTCARHRVDAHAFYQRLGYADVCGRSGRFFKTLE